MVQDSRKQNPKVVIESSSDINDIYQKIYDYNPNNKNLKLAFDDMVADMFNNGKMNQ